MDHEIIYIYLLVRKCAWRKPAGMAKTIGQICSLAYAHVHAHMPAWVESLAISTVSVWDPGDTSI